MRIGNIIEEGRLGGPQNRISEISKHLKDRGIDTTVIFPKQNSSLFKQKLDAYGVKYIQIKLHRITKDKKHLLAYLIFSFYETIMLYRIFRKERFDLIHCSGGAWQFKGLFAARMAKSETLWHLNDTEMPPLIRQIFRFLALKMANGLIVSGQRVKEYYVEKYALKAIPIFECLPPVPTDLFDPKKIISDSIISSKKGLKIVTVANINPKKGLEYFILMAALLNQNYDNLTFFIVGAVYYSQKRYIKHLLQLRKKLKIENLHFYGACHNIPAVLKSTDIFVCTSISEAGPMAVWEAMSMKKAIVSTDVGDVSRFLVNKKVGFVVPIKNSCALAAKVGFLIENDILRKEFGIKARRIAIEMLDAKKSAHSHELAYSRIFSS